MSIDQSVVDLDIPFRLGGFASTTIQLIGIVGVMTKVTWQVLLLVVPMAISCLWMQVIVFSFSKRNSQNGFCSNNHIVGFYDVLYLLQTRPSILRLCS